MLEQYLIGLLLPIITAAASVNISIVSVNNTPLENIIVYLAPSENQAIPNARNRIVHIGQKNRAFTPYISIMQKGTKISFTNQDDITHHIYSVGGPTTFAFKIRSNQKKSDIVFINSGEISMGCNIHDWMSGYLLVVDTPYFAITNNFGKVNFNLNQLGKYRLTVWHPQMQEQEKNINKLIDVTHENTNLTIGLTRKMAIIPSQRGEDDFDFIENY